MMSHTPTSITFGHNFTVSIVLWNPFTACHVIYYSLTKKYSYFKIGREINFKGFSLTRNKIDFEVPSFAKIK